MGNSGKPKIIKSYQDRRTGKYSERLLYSKEIQGKAVELFKRKNIEHSRWADIFGDLLKQFPDNVSLVEGKLTPKTVKAWAKRDENKNSSASDSEKEPEEVKPQVVSQEVESQEPEPQTTEPCQVSQEVKPPAVEPQIILKEVVPPVASILLRLHKEQLAFCAKELVKRLKIYVEEEWAGDLEISAILVDQNDFDAIEFFNKAITQELFVHLASLDDEFTELKGLGTWEDLHVSNITEPFLNLISLKAARRDFEGRCRSCPK
jgi:hypothetical protein